MDKGGRLMYSLDSGPISTPRKNQPHHATVTLKIDIRKMNNDGSLDSKVIGNKILEQCGISNKAIVCTSGATLHDCIKNLTTMLEKMNE